MTNEGAGEAELRREMLKACRALDAAKAVGDAQKYRVPAGGDHRSRPLKRPVAFSNTVAAMQL